jgi:hypothetical protein
MYHMTHTSLSSLYIVLVILARITHCDALPYAVSPSSFYFQSLSWKYLLKHPVFHIHLRLSLTQIFTSSTCGKTLVPSISRQSVSLLVASKNVRWDRTLVHITLQQLHIQKFTVTNAKLFRCCFIQLYIRMKL